MRNFKNTIQLKSLFLWAVCSCLLLSNSVFAQIVDRKINGKITSGTGKTLASASVINKRTNIGTFTDDRGAFSIMGQKNDILVITYIGYTGREIRIGNSDVVNITINEEQSKMDEVVVIGYGKSKRVNLTSAQTTVSSKDIEKNRKYYH